MVARSDLLCRDAGVAGGEHGDALDVSGQDGDMAGLSKGCGAEHGNAIDTAVFSPSPVNSRSAECPKGSVCEQTQRVRTPLATAHGSERQDQEP